ncbi:MAG: serine/threonine protein kinase, partial [Solirubrobacterales bacterium]|nr:serine/threonine protein kinase [Solirubrobacterales bacterium]
ATAIEESSLETVVAAVTRIAGTLARLKAECNVGHRDIKPGNLYGAESDWLIGDFGLIDTPDVEGLTRSDQRLGPAHYTAYEVILDPVGASPFPADVYSLGKTLWVLSTGFGFPPEGHQPADTRGFSIADNRAHPKAAALDRLVDTMTRLNAQDRPTIDAVLADLTAWQQLANDRPPVDLGDARLRLRQRLESQLTAEDLRERQIDAGTAAVRRFQEIVAPLNAALADLHPRAEVDRSDDAFTRNVMRVRDHAGMREVVFHWQRCSRVSSGNTHSRYVLRMGRGIDVTADGTLHAHAFVDVGDPETSMQHYYWAAPGPPSGPVGSIAADRILEQLTAEIAANLRAAVDVFVENAPAT